MKPKFAISLVAILLILIGCNRSSPTVMPEESASETTSTGTIEANDATESTLPDDLAPHQPVLTSSEQPSQPSPNNAQTTERIRVERVQFASGDTSATVEDSIVGYEIVDYMLWAEVNQYLNISMATDNLASYFNILAPGETEVAMFNSSTASGGNQYEGVALTTGDYTVRVYMMRSAARRNEVANYRLEMIIAGDGNTSASSGVEYGEDARVLSTNYHATGDIPCAMGQAEPDSWCPFGVVREGNGSGFVEVTTLNGKTFSIYFQNGEVVGAEGGSGSFSAEYSGDQTFVYIGEERYVIPDAVIFGG